MSWRAGALALALLWPLGAGADFQAAMDAYHRGDYETALRELRPLAEQGHANAQYNLGRMYAKGQGVPEDDREAVKWFRVAAEQGHARAQSNLGVMYGTGKGVPKDDREAVKWFRVAAEQGDATAQSNLGFMYGTGKGVPEDDREAVKWYRMAAEQGYASAQFNLAHMYANGQGVAEDDREAVKWYRMAAEQGGAKAQFNLGYMYDTGEGVPEDDREAVKWYRMAAEQGDVRGQYNLGVMYGKGQGVPEDDVQRFAWYNLAAAQGHEAAAEAKAILRREMTASQIARAQELSKTLARRIAQGQATNAPPVASASTPPPGPQGPSRELVAKVQSGLALLGYYPGPADGLPGQRTRAAVRAFQSDLKMGQTGEISQELLALLKIAVAAMAATRGEGEKSTDPVEHSSGSGFFVSAAGHIVTNRHVVEGCNRVTVPVGGEHQPVTVETMDDANDLALLKMASAPSGHATFRQSRRASLGETVTVAGYPLRGFLADDLNVTPGAVSALAGPGNNPRLLQITAPVQGGNSGGPLLDKAGNVIGVVVSKLDAAKVYKATGDFPQNINFAIKGALVRGFLDIHGVNYRTGSDDAAVGGEAVAAKARQFVVPVGCWK